MRISDLCQHEYKYYVEEAFHAIFLCLFKSLDEA
jgi:hypothetical protein